MARKISNFIMALLTGFAAGDAGHPNDEYQWAAKRIREIRAAGQHADSVSILRDPIRITREDYLLMGCDNSSAARNFPDVPREQRETCRWFAGADDLTEREAGYNYHATIRSDGSARIDSFLTCIAADKFAAEPEEVAWHYVRVKQLRAQGVPVDQRRAIMSEEAASRPWAKRAKR